MYIYICAYMADDHKCVIIHSGILPGGSPVGMALTDDGIATWDTYSKTVLRNKSTCKYKLNNVDMYL